MPKKYIKQLLAVEDTDCPAFEMFVDTNRELYNGCVQPYVTKPVLALLMDYDNKYRTIWSYHGKTLVWHDASYPDYGHYLIAPKQIIVQGTTHVVYDLGEIGIMWVAANSSNTVIHRIEPAQ